MEKEQDVTQQHELLKMYWNTKQDLGAHGFIGVCVAGLKVGDDKRFNKKNGKA